MSRSDVPDSSLTPNQRKFRGMLAFVVVALLGGAALLPLASPSGVFGLQVCAFKGLTGLPCPLCGGSRAVQAVLLGDLARALDLNLVALPAIVVLAAITIVLSCEATTGRAVIDWNAFFSRLHSLLPIFVALFCFYWIVHLVDAVRGGKSELVNLRNPVARAVCERFSVRQQ
jgi:hypothetical protein